MKKATLNEQIDRCCEGLTASYQKSLTVLSEENALIICNYISAIKTETDCSDNYKKNLIRTLSLLSRFHENKRFKSMTRDDVVFFLNKLRKKRTEKQLESVELQKAYDRSRGL